MKKFLLFAGLWMTTLSVNAVQLTGNYDTLIANNYRVNNNVWNDAPGTQTLEASPTTCAFTVVFSNHTKPTNGAPASYPFILKGCHWGLCTPNNPLPRQLSGLNSASTNWLTTGAPGTYNTSFDIWFNTTPTTTGQPDGQELMVWLNKQGSIQPIGSVVANNVSINGALWQVWHGGIVTSYVRLNGATTVSGLELKNFMLDAQSRGYVNPAWYLISVEAGFEIWQGGTGLKSRLFTLSIL